MSAVKGCMNQECKACQKKVHYKKSDEYCSKCGEKLQFVCKKCHKQFPDDSTKYCDICNAKKEDKNQKIVNGLKKVGVVVLSGVTVVVGATAKINKDK